MSTDVVAVEFTVTQEEVARLEAHLPADASAPGECQPYDVRFRVLIPPVGSEEDVKTFLQERNELDELVWVRHYDHDEGIRVGPKLVMWRRTVLALALHRLVHISTGGAALGRAIIDLDAFDPA